MENYILPNISLTLFDGGAGESGGAGQPAAEVQGAGALAGSQQQPGGGRRAETTGGDVSAGTGAQGPDAGGEAKEPTEDEKRAKFRELINTEYKDIYAQEFQAVFDRRFKGAKQAQERLEKQQPILDSLMAKYKIEDGDIDKLSQAIDADDAYWSDAAEEAGMSVDQYKRFERLQRENEAFRRAQRVAQGREAAQRQLDKWSGEARGMSADYPGFDLEAEVKNPQFLAMLKAGVPVRHAYEVAHLDEIKGGVARKAAQQTEKNVVDGIRAKGARPVENGVSSQSGMVYKSDVSKLTKKDRADIARRAVRGEVITLK